TCSVRRSRASPRAHASRWTAMPTWSASRTRAALRLRSEREACGWNDKSAAPARRAALVRRRSAPGLQADAVALGVLDQTDLVDRADVARRQLERDEPAELRHPEPAVFDVHVLPALRLDV